MQRKIYLLILVLLILTGISLRFYNLREGTIFDWDQENSVAYPAHDLLVKNHFPLIGAQTSVEGLRIGPIYTYIAALFFAIFHLDPISGAIAASTLATVTILLGIILVRKIFSSTLTALHFGALLSLSYLIISYDRIPWNVNLLPLASILVSAGLLFLNSHKLTGTLLAGTGIILGLSSHFSAIFLIAISVIWFLFNRKKAGKYFLILLLFIILAILPLMLFNIRHGEILTDNAKKFSQNHLITLEDIPPKTVIVLKTAFETVGRVVIYNGSPLSQVAITSIFIILLLYFRKDIKIRKYISLGFLYLIVYIFGFSLYRDNTPDYYYIGLLPISILGMGLVFSILEEKSKVFRFLIIIFYFFLIYNSTTNILKPQNYSLAAKQKIVQSIKNDAQNETISINLDMDYNWSFGYKYLFNYYQVRLSDTPQPNKTYWISFPQYRFPGKADYVFQALALGYPQTSTKIFNSMYIEEVKWPIKFRLPNNWYAKPCSDDFVDRLFLTPNRRENCQTNILSLNGITANRLKKCQINKAQKLEEFSNDKLDVYQLSEKSYIVNIERQCIEFINPKVNNYKSYWQTMEYILNTIRPITDL